MGHSLGAGVASLFTLLEHARVPPECEMRCVGFATPACCDATLSDYAKTSCNMETVVLRDDIVPRASKDNILKLIEEIKQFSGTMKVEAQTDWDAIKARATNLWEPTRRVACRPPLDTTLNPDPDTTPTTTGCQEREVGSL